MLLRPDSSRQIFSSVTYNPKRSAVVSRASKLDQYFEHLLERAPGFLGGASPTLPPRQFAVTKRDPSIPLTNDLEGRRVARRSEIEPGLGRYVCMAPAVDDDPGDV